MEKYNLIIEKGELKMTACNKCGVELAEGAKFCNGCGTAVGEKENQNISSNTVSQRDTEMNNLQSDAEVNKGMAILSYILFFIPIIKGIHKKSDFVKYHVNQGAILFSVGVGYFIISKILRAFITEETYAGSSSTDYGWAAVETIYTDTATPGWLSAILLIGNIALVLVGIYGIINAAKGKEKPLPVIGDKFTIIK